MPSDVFTNFITKAHDILEESCSGYSIAWWVPDFYHVERGKAPYVEDIGRINSGTLLDSTILGPYYLTLQKLFDY